MNFRKTIIALVFLWVLLGASSVWAGMGHSHQHHGLKGKEAVSGSHALKAVSPFKSTQGEKRPHCKLLGHNTLVPCPHGSIPHGEKRICYLTKECPPGPVSTPSSRSVSEVPQFIIFANFEGDGLQASSLSLQALPLYSSRFHFSLDRPPRSL